MKRNNAALALLCLYVWVGCSTIVVGQQFRDDMDRALAPLNKGFMQTRTLYNRVAPVANLYAYDGSSNAPASNSDHFQQAVYELHSASYDLNGQSLISPDELNNILRNSYNAYTHPIGLIFHRFDFLDSLAIQKNLVIEQNGQLFDVPNRNGSPYITMNTLVAAPLAVQGESLPAGTHYFEVNSQLVMGNQANRIRQISVDFSDGRGWIDLTPPNFNPTTGSTSQRVAVQLNQGEDKRILVRVVLNDGAVYSTIRSLVIPVLPPSDPISSCSGADRINITGYPYTSADYDGDQSFKTASGTAYIYYASENCASRRITKPIVFIDGFDPDNSRTADKIYSNFINRPYIENNSQVRLGDELRQRGYDVIIYDYNETGPGTGGADYIEANALSVAKLLEEVNNRYGSTIQEDFVLIGPSMGSLVAQYALAWMERNNKQHRVRLFISFDGVHQGANIPLGIQQMVNTITQRGLVKLLSPNAASGLHNTRSARQMLIHHADANSESPKASRFREVFLRHLREVGEYPNRSRNIAIINGNNQGSANSNINPCQELLRFSIRRAGLFGLLCSGFGCYFLDWKAFSSAQSGRCLSYQMFSTGYAALALKLPNPSLIGGFSQPAPGNVSYDRVPGSYFGSVIDAGLGRTIRTVVSILIGPTQVTYDPVSKITFIPSTSAADLRTSNDPNFRLANVTLTKCSGATPFDQVYANNTSTDHVEVNDFIANRFRAEIYNRLTTVCPGSCDFNITANSPSVGCNAGVSLNATCSGANCDGITYNWSGNGINQGGQNISFTGPGSNGTFTYTVTASRSGCGNKTATSTVTVSGCGGNPPPASACQEAENATGTGSTASGGNASGGQYRTSYGASAEFMTYTVNVATAGTYTLKLWAASAENATAGIVVNGGALQTLSIGNTGGWSNFAERSTTVSLNAGNNSIRVQGNANGAFNQDRLCVEGGSTGGSCDFNISANSPGVGCNAGVSLNATCSGANCDGISYSWSGNGISQNGQNISFTVPGSNGTYTYTVTASRGGCSNKTANATVNVSGCGGGGGSGLTSGNCYLIRSQRTNRLIQGMGDGSIQQQDANGQTNQIWKADDVGNSRYRFSLQDGTNRAIRTPDGNFGQGLLLSNYTGDAFQQWRIEQNGNTGFYRVIASNNNTWDLRGAGIEPVLQLWGNTNEGFVDFRSFRFEPIGCGGGNPPTPPNPPGGSNPTTGSYEGFFDWMNCSGAGGWVWNSSFPNQSIVVEMVEGSNVVATLTANNFRQDLQDAGKGDGRKGFSWTIPNSLKNGQNRSISVRVQGQGYVLNNSPRTINCPAGGRLEATPEATEFDGSLHVSPNPTDGRIRIRFGARVGQTYTLRLTDLSGRSLQHWDIKAAAPIVEEELLLPESAHGTVLLRLLRDGQAEIRKVVVVR